jgi:hypothetical protein
VVKVTSTVLKESSGEQSSVRLKRCPLGNCVFGQVRYNYGIDGVRLLYLSVGAVLRDCLWDVRRLVGSPEATTLV